MDKLKWQTPELVLCGGIVTKATLALLRYSNCYDYYNLPPETLKQVLRDSDG